MEEVGKDRRGGGRELAKLRANNLQTLNVFWLCCSFLIRRSQPEAAAADQRHSMHPPAPRAGRGTSEVTQHTPASVNLITPGTALR